VRPPLCVAVALVALLGAGCGGSSAGSPDLRPSSDLARADPAVDLKLHVGGQPCGISSAGGSLWVSNAATARLLRIDPDTHAVTTAAVLDPTPCEITPGFGSLWVITQTGKVDRVDPSTGHVIARIPVGATSYQAMPTPGALWVSNRNDGTLTRIDPRRNRVVQTVHLPGIAPGGLAYAAGALWIGDDTDGATHVLRMDLASGRTGRVKVGQRPGYLTVAGGAVWVSNVNDGTVTRVDPQAGKATATIHVGLSPVNLKPGPDGDVWVPDDTGNRVVRIDTRTAKVVQVVKVDGGPAVVRAFRGAEWVTMFESGEVWRILPRPAPH
jgi:DNA-binding beta-propeller fold protein YncE